MEKEMVILSDGTTFCAEVEKRIFTTDIGAASGTDTFCHSTAARGWSDNEPKSPAFRQGSITNQKNKELWQQEQSNVRARKLWK